MSEYNLTILDLEEEKKYEYKNCQGTHVYFIEDNLLKYTDPDVVNSKAVVSNGLTGAINQNIFKEIKPKTKWYKHFYLVRGKCGNRSTTSQRCSGWGALNWGDFIDLIEDDIGELLHTDEREI